MKRSVFLDMLDIDDAKQKLYASLDQCLSYETEMINTSESLSRIVSKAVYAKVSSPLFSCSAMDGIAIDYKISQDIDPLEGKVLEIDDDFIYVDTGDFIRNHNAVIKIEDIEVINDNSVKIYNSVNLWKNIRPVGEDIVKTEMILPINHQMRPIDIGAVISGGVEEIEVFKKLSFTIVPTGDEIVSNVKDLTLGKIIDSNSHMFKAYIEECGGVAKRVEPQKNDIEILEKALFEALDNDVVIINAGSSSGRYDYTRKVIEKNGEVIFHGVAIKPGKPMILGIVQNKLVIGIPGYPVSAYIILMEFIKPLIEYYNKQINTQITIKATLSKKIYSSLRHKEYVRMKLGLVDGKYIATPLSRGAGVTTSLVEADGFLLIDKDSEGHDAFDEVEIVLSKNINKIKDTLVTIGSNDLVIDLIKNIMNQSGTDLSSSHVGSFGGIIASRNKQCHLSAIHLLDEKTGKYNDSFIKKYLNEDMYLIKGIKRKQGIIVKKGNPKNIKTIEDLVNVRVVNRQKNSGTRVLFDHLLKQNEIDSDDIEGYSFEVSTHSMVAASVLSDFDAGIGVYSVTVQEDLEFIELGYEEYDFLVRDINYPLIRKFIEVLKSVEFKNQLIKMEGYILDDIYVKKITYEG